MPEMIQWRLTAKERRGPVKAQLLDKIRRRDVRLGVVGLGYVGLPLAVEFAQAGLEVVGIDLDAHKVAAITRGESYIPDVPTATLAALVQAGRLSATTDFAALRACDAVSICVPTRHPATCSRVAVDVIVPVSGLRAAEMVKLLENTFRAVNIGLVNEMALMCAKLEVNVWEVIEAASTKPYGYMKFTPGPGIGGHWPWVLSMPAAEIIQ